jgi:hypothetical protein
MAGLRGGLWIVLIMLMMGPLVAGEARAQAVADSEAPRTVTPAADAVEPPTNAVYLELLGPGLFYTINYEHRFWRIAARVGFSYLPDGSGSLFSTPLSLTYLAGSNSPYGAFEIGVGAAIIRLSNNSDVLGLREGFAIPMLIIGGRRQSRDGRFLLRGGFSPIIGNIFLPLPYLAVGLTF